MGRSALLWRETPKCKGKQVLKILGLRVLGLLRKMTPSPIVVALMHVDGVCGGREAR
ncbi:hypothetical protein PITC_007900 [Penicillium italicum]|uniref:Uncharacterized protein n=1 Tax=Penicillium italicum TaxID=40296 RepID=A0A0A2KCZ6_PENIT|nr:hypothetical protein PITC_007900 [Penicillium italicum]